MELSEEILNRVEKKNLFAVGHRACGGCGQALAARLVADAAGENTIACVATGCLEIFSSPYPDPSWRIPFLHSLFENVSAVASGVEAAYKVMKKGPVNIIAMGGDGSTADIGFQSISGMFERGHQVLYICYDNEAYMNTGVQRSGLTPFEASTSTAPSGKESWGKPTDKKPMLEIAAAHGIPYAATASVGYYQDLVKKVKKALSIKGPKYLQIHCPCPLGWKHDPALTIKVGQVAVQTGLIPLVEIEYGKITGVRKITKRKPVEEYLKLQGRFKHLFKKSGGEEEIKRIQAIADANIEKYHLV
jgi:pyruvate ferredoxin oxidoreductase beta subunit